jgi:hypothetical protein
MTALKNLILSEEVNGLRKIKPNQLMNEKIDGEDPTILFAIKNGKIESAKCIWEVLTAKNKSALRKEYRKEAVSMAILSENEKILDFVLKEFICDIAGKKIEVPLIQIAAEKNCRKNFLYLLERGAQPERNYFLDDIKNAQFKEYFFSFEAFIDLCQAGNIKAINIYWANLLKWPNSKQDLFFREWLEPGLKACKNQSLIQHLLSFDLSQAKIIDCCPKVFSDYANFLPLSSNKDRKKMANAVSLPSPEKIQQKGRISKKTIGDEIKRPPRSFSHERERQLLRQIATQLFLALENYSSPTKLTGKLVEVQCMHLRAHGCSNLFIAANEAAASHRLAELLKNNNLEKILTQQNLTSSSEGNLRSIRYSKKIKSRIFRYNELFDIMNPTQDDKNASRIKSILKQGKIEILEMNLIPAVEKNSHSGYKLDEKSREAALKILSEKHRIVLLKTTIEGYELRHAEEFLSDIVDLVAKTVDIRSAVGGKKRPCMGCTGRLSHSAITLFGRHPGRLFVNTVEHQSASTAAASIQVIANNSCYVTEGHNHALYTDFDSASDSDGNDEAENDSEEMPVIQPKNI